MKIYDGAANTDAINRAPLQRHCADARERYRYACPAATVLQVRFLADIQRLREVNVTPQDAKVVINFRVPVRWS